MKLPLKLNNENDIYYNCTKAYSYNLFMHMIDGGRGIGKTTTFLIDGLHQVEKGFQFVYIRRYKSEVKEFVNKDSLGKILDDVVYKGDGNGGYTMIWNDTILGYVIPLSVQRSYKSVDFSKVNRIIYDEAIVKQNATYRYLQDEVIQLFEFMSTVFRTRTNVKVILLGNNEDIFNPFAAYFHIPLFQSIFLDKEHGIYCEHAKNSPKLIEMEKQTGLYALVKDTAYGDYHYDNKVLGADRVNIGSKPTNARILFRLVFNEQTVNVYTCAGAPPMLYFERRDKIIKDNITYVILENGNINYLYVELYRKKLRGYVYRYYFNGNIIYNDEKAGAVIKWLIEQT